MSEKKPCVLEGVAPGEADRAHEAKAPAPEAPCALLRPDPHTRPSAPPEDESADPVGDGHSDAEFAAQHPVKHPQK